MKLQEIEQQELTNAIEEVLSAVTDLLQIDLEYDYEIESYQKETAEGEKYDREILKLAIKNISANSETGSDAKTDGAGESDDILSEYADEYSDSEERTIESLLIGYHGQTLERLQHIISSSLSQKFEALIRVVLDIDGYREKRVESLTAMAHRVEGEVIETGREIELSPMSPAERRVIHKVLTDGGRVTTESIGAGRDRRIVVKPLEFEA